MMVFEYRNHRGEVKERRVVPVALDYLLEPGYGYDSGWFLTAYDHTGDRNGEALRSFALERIVRDTDEWSRVVRTRILFDGEGPCTS